MFASMWIGSSDGLQVSYMYITHIHYSQHVNTYTTHKCITHTCTPHKHFAHTCTTHKPFSIESLWSHKQVEVSLYLYVCKCVHAHAQCHDLSY